MVIVVIIDIYSSIEGLMWENFEQKYVKMCTFFSSLHLLVWVILGLF